MAALASKEARLVSSLREYRERLEERLRKAKKSVEEMKKKLDEEDFDLKVKEVKRELKEEDPKLRILRRALEKETGELPSQRQMEGAAQGIFLLQVIHHLHSTTFSTSAGRSISVYSVCFTIWTQQTHCRNYSVDSADR